MGTLSASKTIAGVDGCKGGWIAVVKTPDRETIVAIHPTMESLITALPGDAVIAVDMPIGLPERCHYGGRGPEALVRPFLGMLHPSSVFQFPRAQPFTPNAADSRTSTNGATAMPMPALSRAKHPRRRAAFRDRLSASFRKSANSMRFFARDWIFARALLNPIPKSRSGD